MPGDRDNAGEIEETVLDSKDGNYKRSLETSDDALTDDGGSSETERYSKNEAKKVKIGKDVCEVKFSLPNRQYYTNYKQNCFVTGIRRLSELVHGPTSSCGR